MNDHYDFCDPNRLRQLVLMDDLTGLFNRRYFRMRLDEEEKRSRKNGKKFCLMMLDVDRFKNINDMHGHIIGDRVLVHVGKILRRTVRGGDIVCRWAGDEFVVILPESGEDETGLVAKRIIENVKTYPWEKKCKANVIDVSVSLGFSVYPDDASDLMAMVESADRALYAAKKKGRPVRARNDASMSGLTNRKNGTPTVYGKHEEIENLHRCIARVRMEDPQFILIRGDMGVGKSFVVERLESEMKKLNMVVLHGRCNEKAVDTPFSPFTDLFNHFMAHENEREILSSIELPEASLAELGRLAPRWIKNRNSRKNAKQDSGGDKFLLFEAFGQLLRQLSAGEGVVLVIEDIQWVDVTSLALLHFLARTIDRGKIGVILTHRPLDNSYGNGNDPGILRELISLERERKFQSVLLRPLSKEESIDMIRELLGDVRPAENSIEELYRITEGNPFFIKGLVEFLGKSERMPGVIDDLPPTIHEAVGQKIERLSAEARTAFQAASVLGREFEFDVLLKVLHTNEGFLLDIIDEGIRLNIIEEVQGYSGDRYSFVQNIICKAIYASIPVKSRREIHLNSGHAIELLDVEGLEERFGELAHHFEVGGDEGKALDYTMKAARKACDLYAHEEAVSFFTKAVTLARSAGAEVEEDVLIDIYEERGLVYQQMNDYRRAQRDFERVIEICTTADRSDRLGYALKNLSSICIYKREFKKAYEYSLRTIRHAIDTGDSGLKAESLTAFGNIYLFSGEYEKALTYYQRALEMDRRCPDELRASKVYTNLGVISWFKEKNGEALDYYQKALKLLQKVGNKTFQPLCINNIAMITLEQGLFSKALSLCEESLDISKETGNRLIEAYTYNNIGEIYQRIGDFESALVWSRKAISLIKEIRDQGSRSDFMRNRGAVHYLMGHTKKAEHDLEKALALSRGTGKKEYEMNALYWLIIVLADEGNVEEARQHLMEFQDLVADRKTREYSLKLVISSAIIHIREGKYDSALWDLTRFDLESGELDPHLLMLYLYRKAEVFTNTGSIEQAREEIERAWKQVAFMTTKLKDKSLKECFLTSPYVLSIKTLRERLSSSPRE